MKRAIFSFLFCVIAASAQQTVLQKLLTNVSTVPQITAPINNVGQSGHSVLVQFSDAPGNTCSSARVQAELEYSFNNTSWFAFGSPVSNTPISAPNAPGVLYVGSGVFNYIRFNLSNFDTTNCRITAWYSGALTYNPLTLMAGAGSNADKRQYNPIVACDKMAGGASFAPGPGIFALTLEPGQPIRVCALIVSNTSAVDGTFRLSGDNNSTCGTGGNFLTPSISLPAKQTFTLGSGIGQLFTLPNTYICLTYTGTNSTFTATAVYTVGN